MPIELSSVLLFFCLFVYLFVCLFTLKSSMIAFSSHRNQMFPIHPFPIASKSGLFSLQREFTVAFNRLLFSTFRRDGGGGKLQIERTMFDFFGTYFKRFLFISFAFDIDSSFGSSSVQFDGEYRKHGQKSSFSSFQNRSLMESDPIRSRWLHR